MSQRLACACVPLFPLAARLRSEPELRGEAVAILQGNGNAARTVAASRQARQAGIRPGMSLSQARALLPRLTVRARDQTCERAAQDTLLEIAESFSPRIEDAGEGVVYVELTGLGRHFPGNTPEQDLAHALAVAAERVALPLWVGIASSKLAARVAAELPSSPTLVPPGQEADFLAPLPLNRLSSAAEVLETLYRWGIRSVGEFARLPNNEVASRLGAPGRELHQKARGIDPHPLVPHQPPPTFTEGMELEWPLVNLEPFLFLARTALERLVQRLTGQALACSRIELSLALEPEGHHQRSIRLPAPTCEVKTLLTLIRLDLESSPPGAPVTRFSLTAHPDRPRRAQLSLFGPIALSPDKLATTLARLFALLGSDRVGSPRPADAHCPDRFQLVEYAPPPSPETRSEPRQGRGLLAVRTLRPPVRLEVITDCRGIDKRTVPSRVLTVVREDASRQPQIDGRIRLASGPWSLEDEWWSQDAVRRDYWDIELSDGGLYRIFRERATGEWYADAVYD